MAERIFPDCPLCGEGNRMQLYDKNSAFLVCLGGAGKVHVRELLVSTKFYPNGRENGAVTKKK